jgi:hypothetical protein
MIPITVKREDIELRLAPLNIDRKAYPLVIVGIRGFQTPDKNKRGVFDDAIVLLTDSICAAFPANTDPTRHGLNPKIGKGYAVLKPGVYYSYRFDTHNGSRPHPAICQRVAPVTVIRDGGKAQTGMLGINIHAAFGNSTSSDGCQTQPEKQFFEEFYPLAKSESLRLWGDKWNLNTVCYVLLEA